MKQIYLLLFLISGALYAQTTVNYPQQVINYSALNPAAEGVWDSDAVTLGMWANSGITHVAWRNFTEDGTTTGTPSIMAIGDSFTITTSATRAWGQIGVALLSSPTTTSWADRFSNYAVQVNLDGNSGAFDLPWRVVSTGGTSNVSTIFGTTAYLDYKFTFTLNTATTMTVSINDGAESFNVTLNNQNITGYSIYFDNDWNGIANADIFWKPTTEYTYSTTLRTKNFESSLDVSVFPNPVSNTFSINKNISDLKVFDLTGKLVKEFKGDFNKGEAFDISNLSRSLYILKITNNSGQQQATKLVKL